MAIRRIQQSNPPLASSIGPASDTKGGTISTQVSTRQTLAINTMAPKQLNFITGNQNKLSVVKAILGSTVDLQSQALNLVEIQGTIEEISADKCRRAAEAVCLLT